MIHELTFLETLHLFSKIGGLCSFAEAQRTGKRKYKKHAMKARSIVKGWLKQGCPNVKHYGALFDAETAALQVATEEAEKNYQFAISTAGRSGLLQDSALANERYGTFLFDSAKDHNGALFHFKTAIKLYHEWGATQKANLLEDRVSLDFPGETFPKQEQSIDRRPSIPSVVFKKD